MSGNSTFSVIIVIAIVGVVIFIIPLISLEGRIDNVAQQEVQKILDETSTEIANTGEFTREIYQNMENRLAALGKTYDIGITLYILDENPEIKLAQGNYTKIGENIYVIYYETQVLPQIGIKIGNETVNPNNDKIKLKPGDKITLSAESQDSTAQDLKSSFLGFSNKGEKVISVTSSAMCTVLGAE